MFILAIIYYFAIGLNDNNMFNFLKFALVETFGLFLTGAAFGTLDPMYRGYITTILYFSGGFLVRVVD